MRLGLLGILIVKKVILRIICFHLQWIFRAILGRDISCISRSCAVVNIQGLGRNILERIVTTTQQVPISVYF